MFRFFRIICKLFISSLLITSCGNNGSSSSGQSPTIVNVAPAGAIVGKTVTIVGTNFSTTPADNIVSFNGTTAVVLSSTSTQIITKVPAGATNGPVTVTVRGKSALSTTNFNVLVLMGGAIQRANISLTGTDIKLVSSVIDPHGITTDGTNLYVTDFGAGSTSSGTIIKIEIETGIVTQLVNPVSLLSPHGITTDGTYLYVTDVIDGTISKVEIATGTVTTLVGAGTFAFPHGITTDGTNLYVYDSSNKTISKVAIATGAVTLLISDSTLSGSGAITTDGTYLYVARVSNGTISKVSIATGTVTQLVGTGNFIAPVGITTDGTYLYVVDLSTGTVSKVLIATGAITELVGTGSFIIPFCITTDGKSLYII
jgi:IPT/TIG domain